MEPVHNSAVIDLPKVAHRPEEQSLPTELATGFEAQMAVGPPAVPDRLMMAEIGMTVEAAPPADSGDAQVEANADEGEALDAGHPRIPETLAIGPTLERGAAGEIEPVATGTREAALPQESRPLPMSEVPVQAAALPPPAEPRDAEVRPVPQALGREPRPEPARGVLSRKGADPSARRDEIGAAFHPQEGPWQRRDPGSGATASATEPSPGSQRNPALSAVAKGAASHPSPENRPWTTVMLVRPTGQGDADTGIAAARDSAQAWTAAPSFSLSALVPPQHMVASPAGSLPGSPDMLCRQIGEAVLRMTDDRVEIALSPEELGSVRLVLSRGEAGAAMTVWVERPEVLEMLRRNADVLTADLQKSGLGDATLVFQDGSGRQGRGGADPSLDGPGTGDDRRQQDLTSDGGTVTREPRSRPPWTAAEGLRLDIRV